MSGAIQTQFDDVVMGIFYAYVQAAEEFLGTETHNWNSKASLFLWLLFHIETIVMGPKREKSGREKKTINECAMHRLNLFWCGHIKVLWKESTRSSSSKPGMAPPTTQEEIDKSVQDAVDKDNY